MRWSLKFLSFLLFPPPQKEIPDRMLQSNSTIKASNKQYFKYRNNICPSLPYESILFIHYIYYKSVIISHTKIVLINHNCNTTVIKILEAKNVSKHTTNMQNKTISPPPPPPFPPNKHTHTQTTAKNRKIKATADVQSLLQSPLLMHAANDYWNSGNAETSG